MSPTPPAAPAQPAWHALPVADVFSRIASGEGGLDDSEARRRLERHGRNRLAPARRTSWLRRFLLQFHNVLIYVLLAAAAVTAGLGHVVDCAVILSVVVINAVIGVLQEGKAERALDAIRGMLTASATVLRGGGRLAVDAETVVPGDVVALQSGDRVPADLRLFQVRDLRVDESALTGESLPVEKDTATAAPAAAVGDRRGMAFSGTLVTYGQAMGVVVATGDASELGRINALLAGVEPLTTPLLRQVARFGRALAGVVAAVALITFLIGVLVWDQPVSAMFMAVVGLAVAAIPEGLPAILTITLAIGVQRMAARRAIIRRLPAIDTLGAVTVICSDKTGTLTRNEMTVRSLVTAEGAYGVDGAGYAPVGGFSRDGAVVRAGDHADLHALLRAGLLCNDARLIDEQGSWVLHGDPTEGALVSAAIKAGEDAQAALARQPRSDAIPFESEHRFMATLHHDHAGHAMVYVKGAPERVLAMCDRAGRPGAERPLDAALWRGHADALARRGERVLALACRRAPAGQRALRFADVESGLILLGLAGMIDPPRPEATAAVADCRAAGIRVKMITGDHALTAAAIAGQMGIGGGQEALTGERIDRLDDAALRATVADADVFARVSPEHKLRLVQAVRARGEVVAMTGDGVNDAPALRQADVGVAMGHKGTEVAKEAADMVITDDDFAAIRHAVEIGRAVYDNLRKTILFTFPTNGGEALIIIAAIALGLTLPITPAQILWVNMVTSVLLAIALAFEPPEPDLMRRPPRRLDSSLLPALFVWRIVLVALLMAGATFAIFERMLAIGQPLAAARTAAVNALVAFEAIYLLNTRSILGSGFALRSLAGNPWVPLSILATALLQALYTYLPLSQRLFGTAGIGAQAWIMIAGAALTLFLAVEAEKAVMRHVHALRHRRRQAASGASPRAA